MTDDRAAVGRKRRACGEAGRIFLAVALVGHRPAALELHAFEGIDELDIDHARESVRAVDGGGTTGEDLHAADQRRREDVQVHGPIAIGRHQPPSIEQHQRPVGAEAAQRHVGLAVVRRRVRRGTGRRHELWIRNERTVDRDRTRLRERFLGHGDDRAGRTEIRACDARTGDDDNLEQGLVRRRVARRRDQDGERCPPHPMRQVLLPYVRARDSVRRDLT